MNEEENSDEKAEMRLAVVAAVAGNDYANNAKVVGLKKLCNMAIQVDITGQDTTAGLLMEKISITYIIQREKARLHINAIVNFTVAGDGLTRARVCKKPKCGKDLQQPGDQIHRYLAVKYVDVDPFHEDKL